MWPPLASVGELQYGEVQYGGALILHETPKPLEVLKLNPGKRHVVEPGRVQEDYCQRQ